jgi:hypothetical protein
MTIEGHVLRARAVEYRRLAKGTTDEERRRFWLQMAEYLASAAANADASPGAMPGAAVAAGEPAAGPSPEGRGSRGSADTE